MSVQPCKNVYNFLYFVFFLSFSYVYSRAEIVELDQNEWMLFRDIRMAGVREFPQAFGSTYEEELEETESSWKRRLKYNMIFAKVGNEIVGMIGAVIDSREKLRHVALVISFYVIPEFRSEGVGSLLLESIIDRLDGFGTIKKIVLKVTTSQTQAICLYTKFGFSIEGILKNEYFINNKFYDQFVMSRFNKFTTVDLKDQSAVEIMLFKQFYKFI